jgi:hypothetical protein
VSAVQVFKTHPTTMTHLKPDLVDNNLTKLLQYIAVAGQEIACKLIGLFEMLRSLKWALQGKKTIPLYCKSEPPNPKTLMDSDHWTKSQLHQTPCKQIGHPDQRLKTWLSCIKKNMSTRPSGPQCTQTAENENFLKKTLGYLCHCKTLKSTSIRNDPLA